MSFTATVKNCKCGITTHNSVLSIFKSWLKTYLFSQSLSEQWSDLLTVPLKSWCYRNFTIIITIHHNRHHHQQSSILWRTVKMCWKTTWLLHPSFSSAPPSVHFHALHVDASSHTDCEHHLQSPGRTTSSDQREVTWKITINTRANSNHHVTSTSITLTWYSFKGSDTSTCKVDFS